MDLEGGAEAGAGAGARQTCECVSSSVAEVVHSIQHLLLGAKVIQVPLGLGGSTVLSQTWKGRSPHSTESDWEGWGSGHTGHREGMFAKLHFPHKVSLGASCLPSAGGDLSFA